MMVWRAMLYRDRCRYQDELSVSGRIVDFKTKCRVRVVCVYDVVNTPVLAESNSSQAKKSPESRRQREGRPTSREHARLFQVEPEKEVVDG